MTHCGFAACQHTNTAMLQWNLRLSFSWTGLSCYGVFCATFLAVLRARACLSRS